ncbi:hypothetical protein PSV08DRAFT_161929, partial [Bipolaris maydis]|uniref:uncharacterized protein n=1 Tax=Cochliobolus heterostrophus TaxID=5016 RepID=UPI0024D52458
IFIHGLTGDSDITWTNHDAKTFTPDLVCTQFPSARVIIYGYDADIVGLWKNASGEGLRGYDKALAYAISNSRPDETKRPLFFIVHSLGGLFIKQAILVPLDPSESLLQSAAPCTAEIMFMDTPHSGPDLAKW